MKTLQFYGPPGAMILEPSDSVQHFVGTTGQTFTVPTDADIAIFRFDGVFWALHTPAAGTPDATAPTVSDTTASAQAECQPVAYPVTATDKIDIAADSAVKGSISYYKLRPGH